jgi:hypothetical protein
MKGTDCAFMPGNGKEPSRGPGRKRAVQPPDTAPQDKHECQTVSTETL